MNLEVVFTCKGREKVLLSQSKTGELSVKNETYAEKVRIDRIVRAMPVRWRRH